ncbi:esterase [Lithospermum erythrorhizon]|uniref:Pectinesterase n=1 Tax=Lithospermum erythrorhizon TaxID=34254 RepID=A0AAV3NPX1_LITER
MATPLNPYGKMSEADQERLVSRRNTRKRVFVISLSSIVLVAVVVAAVVGATSHAKGDKSDGKDSMSSALKVVCDATLYPESCYSSMSPLVKSNNVSPQDFPKLAVQVAINQLSKATDDFFQNDAVKNVKDNMTILALESCQELLSLAFDHLNDSLAVTDKSILEAFDDLGTWLSSAGTYQETCIDGLLESNNATSSPLSTIASEVLRLPSEYTSNSLAIVSSIQNSVDSVDAMGAIGKRRLLMDETPAWLSFNERKLLQAPRSQIKFDAVVAKDGSGKYKRIKDALKAVPEKSDKRFVIYVKKGVYNEHVTIEKTQWNVMIVGDGMDATVVTGSLNFIDGTPTFQTATFAVKGKGFIARDMKFVNSAGAAKHQAVAMMSTADLSVFYRCKMDAFQDTLYPHSNRQFYRECTILGTVDFIFGNSAVVLQNCNILPRKPMPGQQTTITAQGKIDPNQNTGIVIHNCVIKPYGDLSDVNNFLGRPWKNHSTTVFMKNNMAGFIHPNGWLPWIGNDAPPTIFYAEFQNTGPGAVTKNRVKWRGLRLDLNANQANKFTVQNFISGHKWLSRAGVVFKAGL